MIVPHLYLQGTKPLLELHNYFLSWVVTVRTETGQMNMEYEDCLLKDYN